MELLYKIGRAVTLVLSPNSQMILQLQKYKEGVCEEPRID